MTPRQVELVRSSWAKAEPISETAARLFYRRLFDVAPELRPLFKTSISEQGDRLIETLGEVVAELDRLDTHFPEHRGRVDCGGEPEHEALVGESLLWTLRQVLGEAFSAETGDAWSEAFETQPGAVICAAALAQEERELAAV